jgi:hypothetical protein
MTYFTNFVLVSLKEGRRQAPNLRSQALCSIKSDSLNLIHQCDVVVNGRSIEQCQDLLALLDTFKYYPK